MPQRLPQHPVNPPWHVCGRVAGGTHRNAVVVQDAVLGRHELEVDEVGPGPQDVVGNHGLDQLVLGSTERVSRERQPEQAGCESKASGRSGVQGS